ncbi:invasin [Salmonella enterica subsp. enterica serovar Saintpaul]|nr:invasin [Salmonella enterica subsp. enterica serovar Saintpaul]ECF4653233.1 invasin [Salmonella enterica subsp. enterica serovar Nima]EDR4441217.1 invasin [Salmonella enterica subsp. enterica serovar Beaudesert]
MKRSCLSYLPADTAFSPGLRRLAWLNIAVQAAFPLALAFTPAMAGAGEQHFLAQPVPLSAQRTQVYTLSFGETAASVAKKYHLTLDQLRELNQFRTFAHGFSNLQSGDELDVPVAPLPEVLWKNDASANDIAEQNSDKQTQMVAGYASQAGSFLSSGARGDAAASMARGMATGEAGGALQQWLSRFGTARIQLDADKNFSLKNSQFDLLLPLYEQQDRIVFTQGSLHRTDGRTQANLGAGIRHFYDSWMFGANSFVDYDLSRDHARAGAGLEYWRDFLKLGFNGYTHLTGWKDSPDLDNYQERPANGWDIRAQAWLPSLPQLGGKLTYEQYYGNEVALFGVDNRQKNPHAITAGINYTPVPLITLGAEQRQGQSGKNDTRLTVDMNYQLGIPWRNQVDPTSVAAMRSLIGSRYDLVERNNNIVLEYRRKEMLRLHTADLITGKGGEKKSLQVSVTSTYGLSHIDWDASALNAAGGKIVQNGSDYVVVLPPYQTTAQAVNTYTVSGVAVDRKGNRSDRSDTQVTVQAPEVNKQYSTFTPANSVLPADGKSTQVLTLALRDENNQAVDIDVKDISLKSSTLRSASVSALNRKSAGVYTVTVTAGVDVENITLTPAVNGITLSSAVVSINSTTPDAGQSVFTANPETIPADNTATSTLTLIVKDAQGNPLTGLKDLLTFTVKDSSGKAPATGVITESTITESSTAGTYIATLKGTKADKYTIVPEYNGTVMGSLSAAITLTAISPDEKNSAINTDATTYVSGSDMTVTVTLKDSSQNPLTGDAGLLTDSTITVPNAMLKTGSSWKDNGDGTYTATYIASTVSSGNQAALKLAGWAGNRASQKYDITAIPELNGITVNGNTFAKDSGFPTTGFIGATFTLKLTTGSLSDYTWTSDASWVSVTDGTVKFTGTGTGDKVTITGTPTSGQGDNITYSFTLNRWFISDDSGDTFSDAESYCASQSGYSQPMVSQLTNDSWRDNSGSHTQTRTIGSLWSEWGDVSNYSNSGIASPDETYWSGELRSNTGIHYYPNLNTGDNLGNAPDVSAAAICQKTL